MRDEDDCYGLQCEDAAFKARLLAATNWLRADDPFYEDKPQSAMQLARGMLTAADQATKARAALPPIALEPMAVVSETSDVVPAIAFLLLALIMVVSVVGAIAFILRL